METAKTDGTKDTQRAGKMFEEEGASLLPFLYLREGRKNVRQPKIYYSHLNLLVYITVFQSWDKQK